MKNTLKAPRQKGRFGVQWIIWGILMAFMVWFFWDMAKDPVTGGITVVFMVLIGGIGFSLCWLPSYNRKKKAQKAEVARRVSAGEMAVGSGEGRHVTGLPLPSGVPCSLKVYTNRLLISGSGQNFELPMGRVLGSQLYEDTEMRQHVKSSLGGIILGGIAFGEVGAIIGGMPESKYRKEISKYNLLVSYMTEASEPKALLFTSDSPLKAVGKVIEQYHNGTAPNTTTTL